MKIEELKNNIVCPYCKKTLTAESFSAGKWQCRKCGKLLTSEKWKEFCEKDGKKPKVIHHIFKQGRMRVE